MTIRKVGVAGCGLMGSGIAEVAAKAGFDVTVREVDEGALAAGKARIQSSLGRALAKKKISRREMEEALERIVFTTELLDLAAADIVIEAIVEDMGVKKEMFRRLDDAAEARVIFATNTSSLPVTDMSAGLSRADRFVGLHFFNPVPVMKLVEVVRTISTSEEAFQQAFAFTRELGKTPVAAKDNSGFVVNLLLVPYMLDAIRQLERGVASIKDIDAAMSLGCGHPMGPFMLGDFVGLDTLLRVAEIMYEEYRELRYAPPPLLKRLVAMGRYGRKTGGGFYDWTKEGPRPLAL